MTLEMAQADAFMAGKAKGITEERLSSINSLMKTLNFSTMNGGEKMTRNSGNKTDIDSHCMAKGTRVAEPVHPKMRKSIKELFDGYTGTYQPQKIDWGGAVGKEIEV